MTNSNFQPKDNAKDNAVAEILAAYFAQRGKFLSQVILADLINSPYLPPKYQSANQPFINGNGYTNGNGNGRTNGNGNGQANGYTNGHSNGHSNANGSSKNVSSKNTSEPVILNQNGSNGTTGKNGHAAPETGNSQSMATSSPAARETAAPAPVNQAPSVQDILIELVVKQTGFPAESFSPSARLLDDLNLDSIKSAELVAQVAKQIGVEGQIDPASFANASLAEVAAALEQLAGSKSEVPLVTPVSSSAVSSQTSASRATTAPGSTGVISDEEVTSWVRNFIVNYVAEESESISEQEERWQNTNLFPIDNWATAKVLIVASPKEAEFVKALSQELSQRGATVQGTSFLQMVVSSAEAALLEVLTKELYKRGATVEAASFLEMREQPTQSTEFTHFIAVMPADAQADMTPIDRLQQSMEQMYGIATPPQASAAQRDYTSITYIRFGGGYFGKQQQIHHLDQGCLIGFASTVHLERPDLKVRVIDIPRERPSADLMQKVIDDIAQPDGYLAVGYDANLTRRVPRPVIQDRTQYQKRNIVWTAEDVVLVTGGAKGITAECALAFAQITGVKMALVGSSAHPQDNPTGKSSPEIARTLRRFQQEGLVCSYYACDMADLAAVKALVQQVETELGKVTGVIHGAAVNRARRAENCPVNQALPEISPKVMGMFNLCEVLDDHPPKMFAGISSIGAVIGLPGNSWYSFSNEVLDLLLRRFNQQHPETAVLSLAYSVWDEVGMGARMGTVKNLGRMGIKAIPMKEGVDRFVQLMFNHPGDTQVVITSSLGGVQTLGRGFDTWRVKRVPPPAEYRFIETLEIIDPGIEIVARTHLTLDRDSYVRDHIYNGTYLFPTVFGLEAMAQMVAFATGRSQFNTLRVEDIRLERPIVVDPTNGVTIELRAEIPERPSAQVPQKVLVEIRTEQTGFAKAHFAATFVLCDEQTPPVEPIPRPAQPLGLDPHTQLYGGLLWQGTRFQRLQMIDSLDASHMMFVTQRGVAPIDPDQPFDRAEGPFILGDPYCRDSLLQSVQPMVPQDIGLPIGIQSIQLYSIAALQSERCLGLATGQGRDGRNYSTNVVMTNEQGQVIERMEGYQVRMVEHRPQNPTLDDLIRVCLANRPVVQSTESATSLDEKLLQEELQCRAKALNVTLPKVALEQISGLHERSADERHQEELPVLKRTMNLFLGLLITGLILTGVFFETSL